MKHLQTFSDHHQQHRLQKVTGATKCGAYKGHACICPEDQALAGSSEHFLVWFFDAFWESMPFIVWIDHLISQDLSSCSGVCCLKVCQEMCAWHCVPDYVCLIMALYLHDSLSSNTSAMSLMKTTHQQSFSSVTLSVCCCLLSDADTKVLPSRTSLEDGDIVLGTAAGLCSQTLEMTYVNGNTTADRHHMLM